MSMDLILGYVAWRTERSLDIDAGANLIHGTQDLAILDPMGLEFLDEGEGLELINRLHRERMEDLRVVWEAATEQGFGDTDFVTLGNWHLMITGGNSWGDDPGPTFTALSNLHSSILDAVGFEWPETEAVAGAASYGPAIQGVASILEDRGYSSQAIASALERMDEQELYDRFLGPAADELENLT